MDWGWWGYVVAIIYLTGFVFTLLIHTPSPVWVPLRVARSLLWPYFWATGRPQNRAYG